MSAKRSRAKEHLHHHKDGTLWAKGWTVDGAPTGYWEWFRKDGSKMRSGHFEDGEQVGEWTTYDRRGRVHKVTQMKRKSGAAKKPSTSGIDAYLARVPIDKRRALERLRRTIRSAAPSAEECISYQLPAFRLDGKALVGFGAAAEHCAFYPMSSATVGTLRKELGRFDTSKGAIRFRADEPLPAALVRKVVRTRIAENTAPRRATTKPAARRRGSRA